MNTRKTVSWTVGLDHMQKSMLTQVCKIKSWTEKKLLYNRTASMGSR